MPETKLIPIADLILDLTNYRTVKQTSQLGAIKAMIAISPDYFWALTESLAADGYLPTDNLIVLKAGANASKLIVKEGNRRLAALRILHGLVNVTQLNVPGSTAAVVAGIDPVWRQENSSVPCAIFEAKDAAVVDRIVTRAHGKGEKAGRDQWNTVARARHNRDVNRRSEPGLDLLERYLLHGRNLTGQQRERWSGDFPLTVLDEAIKKLAPRLGSANATALSASYPNISHLAEMEDLIRDIGLQNLRYPDLRKEAGDFASVYGIPPQPGANVQPVGSSKKSSAAPPASGTAGQTGSSGQSSRGAPGAGVRSQAGNDPKYVTQTLKKFSPMGSHRQKVVVLRDEAIKLKIKDTPMAFCFVLRSMFEISAKAYCADNSTVPSLSLVKSNGREKSLADLLRDVASHIAQGNFATPLGKTLHGAMTELGRPEGILSVTSMNALVHNPAFLVNPSDISILFHNIYPLLEAMN